jgi:NAD(P)-dependent dehydrogenase (short-subunit alcohol dehydrogenase family)
MLLRGKLALVAGFGPGTGRDVALALAREGADLVVFGGPEPVMVSVAGEIAALGRKALCVPAPTHERATCLALAERVRDIFGRVDVLVHTANRPITPSGAFEDTDLEAWRARLDAELLEPLVLTQALLPLLQASEDARVVLIGNAPEDGERFDSHAAAQAALAVTAGTLAHQLRPQGIRVNAVHAGRGIRLPAVPGGPREAPPVPADPRGSSVDLAGAVVFFASSLSRAVTGQALHVELAACFP